MVFFPENQFRDSLRGKVWAGCLLGGGLLLVRLVERLLVHRITIVDRITSCFVMRPPGPVPKI